MSTKNRPQESALTSRLSAALSSREARSIRRKLPAPSTLPLQPPSPSNLSHSPAAQTLVDFTTNDYLSLSTSPVLRARFLEKLIATPQILGSSGSRLLVNPEAHAKLEQRLEKFFGRDDGERQVALLFNSGFDANVGFFTCIPQKSDVVVLDEYIHASVHDGVRASRVDGSSVLLFEHNSVKALRDILEASLASHPHLKDGKASIFVAVETLYSMDGTLAPLREINSLLNELFPMGNAYMVVDEAHATGIYGASGRPGRGRISEVGMDGGFGSKVGETEECRVLARLHTFGKALAASGAVILTTPLVCDYMINYARSLIYTTALTHANIIAADCSFDLLEDGTAKELSAHLLSLSNHLCTHLQSRLRRFEIPSSLVSLPSHLCPTLPNAAAQPPTPILPLLTPYPRPLSAYLLAQGMNARPITWPTVPKGKDRVRVCLHSGNTKEDVERLIDGVIEWAKAWQQKDTGVGREAAEMGTVRVESKL